VVLKCLTSALPRAGERERSADGKQMAEREKAHVPTLHFI